MYKRIPLLLLVLGAIALAGCDRIVAAGPPKGLSQGVAALRAGDRAKANQAFDAALAESKNDWRVYLYVLEALGEARSPDVFTYLQRGLQATPKDDHEGRMMLYLAAGNAYDRMGDHVAFLTAANEASREMPDRWETKNGLAYALAQSSQELDRAIDLATSALVKVREQKPQAEAIGVVEDTLGWCYFQQKNYSLAVMYLSSAAEHASSYYEVQGHLGLAYHAKGMEDEAKTALTRAKRLAEARGIDDPVIRRALEDVQKALNVKHTPAVSDGSSSTP